MYTSSFVNPVFVPACPLTFRCEDVKTGQCSFQHTPCKYGRKCWKLTKRICSYYHPSEHFKTTRNTNSNSNTNANVLQKLHTKAKNHNKKWCAKEDRVLVQYINDFPSSYLKDNIINKLVITFSRSAGAIRTRLRNIAKQKNEQSQQTNKTKNNIVNHAKNDNNTKNNNRPEAEPESKSDHEQNSQNTVRKNELYSIFNKLQRYYNFDLDNNGFDAKNLGKTSDEFKQKKWTGDEKQMQDITQLNNPIQHFQKKCNEMEQKYGKINYRSERKIMSTLQLTKELLDGTAKSINKVINNMNDNWLGHENEFIRLTGYDLNYFENIMEAINGPKISQIRETTPIKREEPSIGTEGKNKSDTESVQIKVEKKDDDYNIANNVLAWKQSGGHTTHRHRSKSRSRSMSVGRHRDRSRSRSRNGYGHRHRRGHHDGYRRHDHRNHNSKRATQRHRQNERIAMPPPHGHHLAPSAISSVYVAPQYQSKPYVAPPVQWTVLQHHVTPYQPHPQYQQNTHP